MRIIKKYPNRRLYDTEDSKYITLENIRKLVVEEEPLLVEDAKTGGMKKIMDVFRSENPFSEFQADGETSAKKVRPQVAKTYLIWYFINCNLYSANSTRNLFEDNSIFFSKLLFIFLYRIQSR